MADWGDTPPTFDRQSEAWGAGAGAWAEDDEGGGGEQYLELIGTQMWVAGTVDLGRFRRVSDFVNIVQGYLLIRDAVVLSKEGEPTRLAMPELRVLPDDVAVVGQPEADQPQRSGDEGTVIARTRQRLVVFTRSHLIDGDVYLHGDGSIMAFVDATDPKFIPMTDVRVRWLSDQSLATRYAFALVQRSQILGVATEGIKLGSGGATTSRAAAARAQSDSARDDEAEASGSGFTDRE